MPKISVIIPFYNIDKWLITRSVNSVLSQTFQDFEIIIVDDGSSQEYTNILPKLVKLDKRIRVLHQENKGVSAARNHGINEATGEYIVFLDADDTILPHFFSEAYTLCKKYDIDFLIGGNASMNNKCVGGFNKSHSFRIEKINDRNKSSLIKNLTGDLRKFGKEGGYIGRGPWTRLVRRNIAKEIQFDEDLRMGEDILWNLQVLGESNCVYVAYRIWYLYYINPNSAVHKYNPQILTYVEQSLSKLQKQMNLKDPEQYIGYCSRLLDELRKIYVCFLGNADCNLSKKKKREIISSLYRKEPWIEIRKVIIKKGVSIRTFFKSIAYSMHCFFLILRIKELLRLA